jgi:hypothetical protein
LHKKKGAQNPFQVTIDEETQNQLFERNRALLKPSSERPAKSQLLPIPFDTQISQSETKPFQRDVARTSNYLITNYTQQERLLLHEYTLARAEEKGFPLKTWDKETFLKADEANKAPKAKTEGKVFIVYEIHVENMYYFSVHSS